MSDASATRKASIGDPIFAFAARASGAFVLVLLGGIIVVLRRRDAVSVLSQVRTASGEAGWMRSTGAGPVGQEVADAYIERRLKSDPDLWVIEFESPDMLPPFEATIV